MIDPATLDTLAKQVADIQTIAQAKTDYAAGRITSADAESQAAAKDADTAVAEAQKAQQDAAAAQGRAATAKAAHDQALSDQSSAQQAMQDMTIASKSIEVAKFLVANNAPADLVDAEVTVTNLVIAAGRTALGIPDPASAAPPVQPASQPAAAAPAA